MLAKIASQELKTEDLIKLYDSQGIAPELVAEEAAKQGKKVLVLERRGIVGGSVVTESFGEGFAVDSVQTGGTLRPDIVKDLKLALPKTSAVPAFISLVSQAASVTYGDHLVLDADPVKAAESIRRFSEKDAARWPEFVRFMNKSAKILEKAYATIMPRLPISFNEQELEHYERCFSRLAYARSIFMRRAHVCGVGVGPKQVAGHVNPGQPCLIVYVTEKRQARISISEIVFPLCSAACPPMWWKSVAVWCQCIMSLIGVGW